MSKGVTKVFEIASDNAIEIARVWLDIETNAFAKEKRIKNFSNN